VCYYTHFIVTFSFYFGGPGKKGQGIEGPNSEGLSPEGQGVARTVKAPLGTPPFATQVHPFHDPVHFHTETYQFQVMSAPVADANQLAGHVGNILKLDGGRIMKLVKDPEANFYKGLAARNLDPVALEFIPKFYGVQETDGKRTFLLHSSELACRGVSTKNRRFFDSGCVFNDSD
jgi:hypothetical protein